MGQHGNEPVLLGNCYIESNEFAVSKRKNTEKKEKEKFGSGKAEGVNVTELIEALCSRGMDGVECVTN